VVRNISIFRKKYTGYTHCKHKNEDTAESPYTLLDLKISVKAQGMLQCSQVQIRHLEIPNHHILMNSYTQFSSGSQFKRLIMSNPTQHITKILDAFPKIWNMEHQKI